MTRRAGVVVIAIIAAVVGPTAARAQLTSFQNYHCADGTEFIVGHYPADSRAYVQIDGGAVTLRRRLSLTGSRYSGSGVTMDVRETGQIIVRRPRRPGTACDAAQ